MNANSLSTPQIHQLQPAVHVLEQSLGYLYQAALRAAVKLQLAEHLQSGPKTAEQLAHVTGATPRELVRIVRLLATKSIFQLTSDNQFSLTPAAQFLSKEHKHSLRQAVLTFTDPTFWLPTGELHRCALEPHLFNNMFGMSFYEYWEKNIDEPDNFHKGISSVSALENVFIVDSYRFPNDKIIADIGGGWGGLLLKVLKNNSTLKGILFDREAVVKNHQLHQLGDDSRWEVQAGSFLESCPEADIYLLKYIVHNWSDPVAINILKSVRKSMKPSSKILIIENIISNDPTPHFSKNMDLVQMALFDEGHERTEDEFAQLLTSANLKLNRVITTQCHISILEASPI